MVEFAGKGICIFVSDIGFSFPKGLQTTTSPLIRPGYLFSLSERFSLVLSGAVCLRIQREMGDLKA